MSDMEDAARTRVRDALAHASGLREARIRHETPAPHGWDFWRVRWSDIALVVLLTKVEESRVWAAPVTFETEPDESGLLAPAFTTNLGLDTAIWASDASSLPMCVLEFKVGSMSTPGTEGLPAGTVNWGPTDSRNRLRARLRDQLDALALASWAPTAHTRSREPGIEELLRDADFDEVVSALGSVPLAARLRRGEARLTPEQAASLARVLGVTTEHLLRASQPTLPAELVAEMNRPRVRSLVDQVALSRDTDEIETWQTCAYAVLAMAARDHDRKVNPWQARVRAYFETEVPQHLRRPDLEP